MDNTPNIPLYVWLIATSVLFACLPLCNFILSYEFKFKRTVYSKIIKFLQFGLWLVIIVFIGLPAWAVWFYGMAKYSFEIASWWGLIILIPGMWLTGFLYEKFDKLSIKNKNK